MIFSIIPDALSAAPEMVEPATAVALLLPASSDTCTSSSFRFLPCRRQGISGVERTRTSTGNLKCSL